jgi:hypothetical protein
VSSRRSQRRRQRALGFALSPGGLRSLGPQGGFALPLTLVVLVVGFMLAAVGSVAAISSIRHADRGTDSERALAVAEAGVEQALARQNKIFTADGYPCLVEGSGGNMIPGSPKANGWCPEQTGSVEGGDFTYTVKPAMQADPLGGLERISIVSEGAVGESTRRIALDSLASTGRPAFGQGQMIGLDDFIVDGYGYIEATAGTNGDFYLAGDALVCGDITYGVGKSLIIDGSNAALCDGYTSGEQQITLAPPDPGNVATDNDNDRFFTEDTKVGNVQWDPDARTLKMTGGAALTLGGSNYSFCTLDMQGDSNIYIADGATVRIWFDSPENCGLPDGVEQLSLTGNAEISTTSGDPVDAGLIFVGSADMETTVKLAGDGKANELMIYAPRSDVLISGEGNYRGAVAGKTLTTTGDGDLIGDDSVLGFEIGVQTAYARERFIECVGELTNSPYEGC